MATESRERRCSKCDELLVNSKGIHLGIPFGKWAEIKFPFWEHKSEPKIICITCYDEVTVDSMYVSQRTGDETI